MLTVKLIFRENSRKVVKSIGYYTENNTLHY